MKYTGSKFFAAALAVMAFAATGVFAKADGLTARQWHLTELNGKRAVRSEAFLEINNAQTRFTGNTGCNQMFGSVAVIGRRIDFSKVGTTRRACTDRVAMRQETELVRALETAKSFRRAGDSLELIDRGRSVAKFEAGREQGGNASGLDDRKWVLESIAGRQTFKALPYAFLNFDMKKGSVGGDTSCNVFGGEFKVTAKRLSISDVVSTMRACVEDDRMSVEREFLDGLRRADRFELDDGRLMLYANKKLLLTFRGERK